MNRMPLVIAVNLGLRADATSINTVVLQLGAKAQQWVSTSVQK